MLVVWINRANSRAFIHSMSQVEETQKETSPRAKREGAKWQLQVERKILAGLLGDEEAVALL